MKKKWVEKIPIPKIPKTKNTSVVKVRYEKDTLILDFFKDREYMGRYCMNTANSEYMSYKNGIWSYQGIDNFFQMSDFMRPNRYYISNAEKQCILTALNEVRTADPIRMIQMSEYDYNSKKRERAYERKTERIDTLMNQIRMVPAKADTWIFKQNGDKDYIFAIKDKEAFCTACQRRVSAAGKNNQKIICPNCKKEVQIKKRTQQIVEKTNVMYIQKIDEEKSVARHFDVFLEWSAGGKMAIWSEAVRIIIYKNDRRKCCLYYNQCKKNDYFDEEWWTTNPANRRIRQAYMYPEGIAEALTGTAFEKWIRTFEAIAAAGQMVQCNNLMIDNRTELANVTEYLIKGRFYRLLQEVASSIWSQYKGDLDIYASHIEEIFGIEDRQMINRLRDKNGGTVMLSWLQWADKENKKISDEVLSWLQENKIRRKDIPAIAAMNMGIQQIMNYVIRQQKESYPEYDYVRVLNVWSDYLRMVDIRLHKDINDEMIYRPRELKRRHDEAVDEIQQREAEIQAETYSQRYPQAEAVLKTVRKKLEYAGNEYLIKVPERIVDVVVEGRYLHHCAGSTDRYFERIKNHETYICFLRKKTEPDTPFYTIEVEPGGTIRQHRGMYDEEPEFESVQPFLQEWQQVIKKRMKKEDHQRAAESKKKRLENMLDLKQKNNLRVLKGLEEDFMDADVTA